jgi:hypothetical protein
LKLLCSSKNGVIGLNKKILRLKELVGQWNEFVTTLKYLQKRCKGDYLIVTPFGSSRGKGEWLMVRC